MSSGWCQCCTPQCPDPATINCGVQIAPTNGCGSCAGTGTQCPVNQNCQSNICVSSCNPNTGALCYSPQNTCGQTSTGTVQCDGTCDAIIPANPSYYGQACGCGGAKDCNNNCIGGTQLITYYRDLDADSYGDLSVSQTACSQPAGYVTNVQDCNDANANINPGKIENTQALCSDALDNNCNSLMDCADSSCSGITRTDGKKCCTSPTQCTNDQTCENNVCQVPSKIGNPTCCLTYSECLAAASKNSGNTLA